MCGDSESVCESELCFVFAVDAAGLVANMTVREETLASLHVCCYCNHNRGGCGVQIMHINRRSFWRRDQLTRTGDLFNKTL